AEAQHFLGLAYYEGRGVVKDPSEAAVWFRMAAEQGHAEAQFRLALSCFAGKRGA
ncbi:MAG: SEL1-like repeat protein, partial [Acidobacteriia bacterium]|nr:SEL1-like repeat protein [Terriglobia bacterium]